MTYIYTYILYVLPRHQAPVAHTQLSLATGPQTARQRKRGRQRRVNQTSKATATAAAGAQAEDHPKHTRGQHPAFRGRGEL